MGVVPGLVVVKEFKARLLEEVERRIAESDGCELSEEEFEKVWRWFDQHPEIEIPKERKGRGYRGGVDSLYDERLVGALAEPFYLRARNSARPDQIVEVTHRAIERLVGETDNEFWLNGYSYDRAVCDILNLRTTERSNFENALIRILLSRGDDVEFEWRTLAIRKHCFLRTEWYRDSDHSIFAFGLDLVVDWNDETSMQTKAQHGLFLDTDITTGHLEGFHKTRKKYVELLTSVIENDEEAMLSAEQLKCEYNRILGERPEIWSSVREVGAADGSGANKQMDVVLHWRPYNLVDFVPYRIGLLADHFKQTFTETIRDRYVLCATPGCGLFEVSFRKRKNPKCRICRHLGKKLTRPLASVERERIFGKDSSSPDASE